MEKNFDLFISQLSETNATLDYFTDFEKFWANGIEIPVKREKNLKFKLSIYDKT